MEILLQEAPKGNGPMVIILCSGNSSAQAIHNTCLGILSGLKISPRVRVTNGPALDKHFLVSWIFFFLKYSIVLFF